MQAEPKSEPFIRGHHGTYRLDLKIELPPLVQGLYTLDFWIGRHESEALDFARQAIAVEITESPNLARNFPYSLDQGSIVPIGQQILYNPRLSKGLPKHNNSD
jgi:lipopolysaccharide transport system ATP-binding protein